MTTITPLARADHDDWRTLWGGYLAFSETTVDERITAGTFERLVTPGGDLRGAIARDADGTAVGFVHWLTAHGGDQHRGAGPRRPGGHAVGGGPLRDPARGRGAHPGLRCLKGASARIGS